MVDCKKCGREIKWLEDKFSSGDYVYCKECFEAMRRDLKDIELKEKAKKKRERRAGKKRKIEELRNSCRNKIYDILEFIFCDDIEELAFSKELFDDMINKDRSKQYSGDYYADAYFGSAIGHKRKVINLLREYDMFDSSDSHNGSIYFKGWEEKDKLDALLDRIAQVKERLRIKRISSSEKKFVCSLCEYKWESKKNFGEPAKCPKCNSREIISFKELNETLRDKRYKSG